jgi:hypothetical protein
MKAPKIRLPGGVSQIAVAALIATAGVSTAIGLTVVPVSAEEPAFIYNDHNHNRCNADFSDCQFSAGFSSPTSGTNCSVNSEREPVFKGDC